MEICKHINRGIAIMSDIHILEGNYQKENKSGTVKVVFHVPNTKTNSSFIGGVVSIVSDIGASEATSLLDGTLVEVVKNVRVNGNKTTNEIKTKIRGMWASVAVKSQADMDNNYKFYGTTLSRA